MSVETATVGATGTYPDWATAEAATDNDLVTLTQQWDLKQLAGQIATPGTVAGAVTSDLYFRRFTANTGAEATGARSGASLALCGNAASGDFNIQEAYVHVYRLTVLARYMRWDASATGLTIERCVKFPYSTVDVGIVASTYASGVRIINNVVMGHSYGIQGNSSPASGQDTLVANNTVLNCTVAGIRIYQADSRIVNNLVAGSGSWDFTVIANALLTYNADSDLSLPDDGTNVRGITIADQIIDATPGAEDYHLKPTSTLLGKGADLTAEGVTVDLDGEARPAGGFDIGADQNPAPAVTSVTPNHGLIAGGTSVSIAGSNFTAGCTVHFDTDLATDVVIVSPTEITCKTPAHAAGWVSCTVTNTLAQAGTLPTAFKYNPAAVCGNCVEIEGPCTDLVLGLNGKAGDVIRNILLSPYIGNWFVSGIKDGSGSLIQLVGQAAAVPWGTIENRPITLKGINIRSRNGAWKITLGLGIKACIDGEFS